MQPTLPGSCLGSVVSLETNSLSLSLQMFDIKARKLDDEFVEHHQATLYQCPIPQTRPGIVGKVGKEEK